MQWSAKAPRSLGPLTLCVPLHPWWLCAGYLQVEYYGRAADGAKARRLDGESGGGEAGAADGGMADTAEGESEEEVPEEEGDEEDENYGGSGSRKGKKHPRPGAKKGSEASAKARPRALMEGTGNALRVLRFSKHQRNLFYHLFMR